MTVSSLFGSIVVGFFFIGKLNISLSSTVLQSPFTKLLLLSKRKLQSVLTWDGKSLIKGLRILLFENKIRFQHNLGKNFPVWEVKKLEEVAMITTGASNREDSILDGEYTFFDRSQDIRTSNRYLFDKEAIIIPGEGQEFVPRYFFGKFDLHQRTYAIFNFKNIDGKYLYYHIFNNNWYLKSHAVGSTVKSLRLPMFQSMPLKVPCIEEQVLIADFLSKIDLKLDIERNVLEEFLSQKKYLAYSLFI